MASGALCSTRERRFAGIHARVAGLARGGRERPRGNVTADVIRADSETLRFTRDGQRLLLREEDRLSVVELPEGEERPLPGGGERGGFDGLRSFAGFEDELWVVAGTEALRLHRFSPRGEPVGQPLPLSGEVSDGRLETAPFGAAAALWTGSSPCEVRFDGGRLVAEPIAPGADLLLPLSPGKRLELREGVLVRREGDAEVALPAAVFAAGDVVQAGAVVLDERSAAVLVRRDEVVWLLAIALPSGLVQHRLKFAAVRAARFSSARGHAVLQLDERRVTVVDLRFGRSLKTWDEPSELLDFAVDPLGRSLVLRRSDGAGGSEVFFGSYRDVLGQAGGRGGARTSPAATTQPSPADSSDDANEADAAAEGTEAGAEPSRRGASDGGDEEPARGDDAGRTATAAEPAAGPGGLGRRSDAAGGPARSLGRVNLPRGAGAARGTLGGPALPSRATLKADAEPDAAGAQPGGDEPHEADGDAPPVRPPTRLGPPGLRPGLRAPLLPRKGPTPGIAPASPARPSLLRNPPRDPPPSPLVDGPRAARAAAGVASPARAAPSRLASPASPSAAASTARSGAGPSRQSAAGKADPAGVSGSAVEAGLALVEAMCAASEATDGADAGEPAWKAVDAARDALRALPRSSPIGALASQLGLDGLAEEVVLIAAAPWLRPQLAQRFGALGGTVSGEATLLLLSRLLPEHAATELLAALSTSAPLRRHGVIDELPHPGAPLRLHAQVIERLRGVPVDEPGTHGLLVVPAEPPLLDELTLPEGLAEGLLPRFAGSPRLQLRGRAGSGRKSLLGALAAAHGRRVCFLDVRAPELLGSDGPARLAAALREAALRGLLPCVVGLDERARGDGGGAWSATVASHAGALLAASGPAAAPLPGLVAVDVAPLPTALHRDVVRRALSAQQLPEEPAEALAARLAAGPGVLFRAAEAAASHEWLERGGDGERDAEAAVVGAYKRLRAARLTPGRTYLQPAPWRPALFPQVTEDGLCTLRARLLDARGGAGGASALLSGSRGSGRRLAATTVAAALALDVHEVSAAALGSDVESATGRLASLLEVAAEGELLVLVTGAEELLSRPCPTLLELLHTPPAPLLLSVSRDEQVADAARDALALRVPFPPPDAATREALWRLHLPAGAAIDPAAIAHHELDGGAIRDAASHAAALAAAEGVAPTMAHVTRALRLAWR